MDTETGGFIADKHSLLTIALAVYDGEKVSDTKLEIPVSAENIYQVGKRKFARVKITN